MTGKHMNNFDEFCVFDNVKKSFMRLRPQFLHDRRTTYSGFVQGLDVCSGKISDNFLEYCYSFASLKFLGRKAVSDGYTY